ncbi:MAG: HAMP domain-containing protein [Gammaproteobacteria bacterium]|nr:HAMP domain-containing protein [Gammaproteobacteria bacterium]
MTLLFWRIYLVAMCAIVFTYWVGTFLPDKNVYSELAIVFSLLAVSLFAVLRPIEKRLRELEQTARQLAYGRLEVRARTGGHDSVSHVSEAFNYMAERIESLIRSQQELTNAISHELRTPIARICFELEMVNMAMSHEEQERQMIAIEEDLKELSDLIEELLVYARLGAGGPEMHFKEVLFSAMISECCEKVKELYPEISYEWKPLATVVTVVAEPYYLQRAIQNVVVNASRYASSIVKIILFEKGDHWVLEVEDDGPGIPVEERERVFSPFARLDDSRTRQTGGHGLGLAIVRRIIRWHSGRVWIENSSLGGAKLILTWPQNLQKS